MSSQPDHAREALEQVCARGNLQRARELYAEDFIDHVNALDFHGHDGIARSVALYRAILPDLEIRVLDQSTDGDRVTSRSRGSTRTVQRSVSTRVPTSCGMNLYLPEPAARQH
jgi:hypothetical protein